MGQQIQQLIFKYAERTDKMIEMQRFNFVINLIVL